MADIPSRAITIYASDLERVYEAVAERRGRDEVLQMIYDMAVDVMEMRPPHLAIRLADRIAPGAVNHG